MAPDADTVRAHVRQALAEVEDPCMASAGLDLSVVDLGLICDVRVEGRSVEVDLTFTELGCSFTHHLLDRVYQALEGLDGVDGVQVNPVWSSPRWSPDRLSARARAQLGESTRRLSGLVPPPDGAQPRAFSARARRSATPDANES